MISSTNNGRTVTAHQARPFEGENAAPVAINKTIKYLCLLAQNNICRIRCKKAINFLKSISIRTIFIASTTVHNSNSPGPRSQTRGSSHLGDELNKF